MGGKKLLARQLFAPLRGLGRRPKNPRFLPAVCPSGLVVGADSRRAEIGLGLLRALPCAAKDALSAVGSRADAELACSELTEKSPFCRFFPGEKLNFGFPRPAGRCRRDAALPGSCRTGEPGSAAGHVREGFELSAGTVASED